MIFPPGGVWSVNDHGRDSKEKGICAHMPETLKVKVKETAQEKCDKITHKRKLHFSWTVSFVTFTLQVPHVPPNPHNKQQNTLGGKNMHGGT